MKQFISMSILPFVILFSSLTKAQTDSSFAIQINRLSGRVAVASGSRYNTNQIIIQTEQGLILIDTGISPEYGQKLRDAIKNDLGRDDYCYVINTHHHWDHVQGNQIFSDAMIIAHKNCAARINNAIEERKDFNPEQHLQNVSSEEEAVKPIKSNELDPDLPSAPPPPLSRCDSNLPPPPPLYILYDENFILTPPEISFADRMKLHFKEITIHLIYYGVAHTNNDVIIYIPQEKLLAVGDLFFKNSPPKFIEQDNPEVERWIETLHWLLENHEIAYVVSGHNELLTRTDMEMNLDYIETLWIGMREGIREGASLPEIQNRFALTNKFPRLHKWDLKDQNGVGLHRKNVEAVYKMFTENK